MRRIGVVVLAILATTLVGCDDDDERKESEASAGAEAPGPVPLTKKQARRALVTARNVGGVRYPNATPYVRGCLSLIEAPMDTIQPTATAEIAYDGDRRPNVYELVRSFGPEIDVEQAFAHIGTAIANCDTVDVRVEEITVDLAVAPTAPIKGVPRAAQHSYVAIGTFTSNGEETPACLKVTYLRTGTTITRVATEYFLPALEYHNAIAKIAHQRLKAVVSGKKLSRKVAPPVPRR